MHNRNCSYRTPHCICTHLDLLHPNLHKKVYQKQGLQKQNASPSHCSVEILFMHGTLGQDQSGYLVCLWNLMEQWLSRYSSMTPGNIINGFSDPPASFFWLFWSAFYLHLGQRSKDHVITGGYHVSSLLSCTLATSTSQLLQRLSLQGLMLIATYQTRMLVSVEIVDVNFWERGVFIKYWK